MVKTNVSLAAEYDPSLNLELPILSRLDVDLRKNESGLGLNLATGDSTKETKVATAFFQLGVRGQKVFDFKSKDAKGLGLIVAATPHFHFGSTWKKIEDLDLNSIESSVSSNLAAGLELSTGLKAEVSEDFAVSMEVYANGRLSLVEGDSMPLSGGFRTAWEF